MARFVEFDEDRAIQRAMEVFWKKGYKGSSLRDLTSAMRINPSSLYNTLGDKHELFVRCLQHYTKAREQDYQEREVSSESPLRVLTRYINDLVREITTGTSSCMAIKAAFEVADKDKRVQNILKADSDAAYRFVCSLLTKAATRGEISREEDPALLTDYLISTYIGWYESFILYRDADKIKRMARYVVKQISS